jgi:hypothetical protein
MKVKSKITWRAALSLVACALSYSYFGAVQWLAAFGPEISPAARGASSIGLVIGIFFSRLFLRGRKPVLVYLTSCLISVSGYYLLSYSFGGILDFLLCFGAGLMAGIGFLAPSCHTEMHLPDQPYLIQAVMAVSATFGLIFQTH